MWSCISLGPIEGVGIWLTGPMGIGARMVPMLTGPCMGGVYGGGGCHGWCFFSVK